MTNLARPSAANTEICSTLAKAGGGNALAELREAALKVETASSPNVQSPKPSAINVPKSNDSGYASNNSSNRATPNSTPDTSTKAVFVDGVTVQRWNPLGPKKIKLQLFDDISKPQATQERFNNLKAEYTRPLFEFLRAPPKPMKNIRNIAMTLEILGEQRDTAAPWVLIQCHKAIAKKVRRFFKQSNVEADFKPSVPTPYAPHLPILVHEESPESVTRSDHLLDPLSSKDTSTSIDVAIYGDQFLMVETLCGSEIKAEIHKTIHTATIGGLISAVSKDGNKSLFALTAGHFVGVDRYDEDEDEDEEDSDGEEEDEDDVYPSEDAEDSYELDLRSRLNESLLSKQDSLDGKPNELEQHKQLPWFGSAMGYIYKASQDDLRGRPNLDWALISIECKSLYLPNIIMSNEVTLPSPALTETGLKRKVTIAAARGRALSGSLSQEWSYLALTPDNTMVRSYLVTLDNGQVLNKGDSGAWVTDNETHEVYGHVVASEVFGRAHVIPINDIFGDITTRLSLFAVGLASQEEISSILSTEATFDKLSTLGIEAANSPGAACDETFSKSSNLIPATSTDLKEPAEGTQTKSGTQSPPALPYSHFPQAVPANPAIFRQRREVDEGYMSMEPSPDPTACTPPPVDYSAAQAPFNPGAYRGAPYNDLFTPQLSGPFPVIAAEQGPQNNNAYQYAYEQYGHPSHNMYPGAAQSYTSYAAGHNSYTPGYTIFYSQSYNPYPPAFIYNGPGFRPHLPSVPHRSGTDSGYASTSNSPPNTGSVDPGSLEVPTSSYIPDNLRTYPGSVAQNGIPQYITTKGPYDSKRSSSTNSGYATQRSSFH